MQYGFLPIFEKPPFLYFQPLSYLRRMQQTNATSSKHPPALYVLFTTEMWERFNFYGMRAILVLFATTLVLKGGLGWSKKEASIMYAWYTGLAYLFPIIGGYIADNFLGRRRAIFIGGTIMMLGQFTLAMNTGVPSFIAGLALVALGNGFFKPNISTMVGSLYEQNDTRRDSAFSIFYMGINIGGFLGPIISSNLGIWLGYDMETQAGQIYKYGFASAGVGMLLGLITFYFYQNRLGDIGKQPEGKQKASSNTASTTQQTAGTPPLTKVDIDRIGVLFVFVIFAACFWLGFEQAGSSMNLYTEDYIDRRVGGVEITTGTFQSVNSMFIILLAPLFALLWPALARAGREPSTPVKMSFGLILMGVGFLFMYGAVLERGGDVTDTAIKASLFWLMMAYFFHTAGELCLSPVGLSVFTKLSPPHLGSMLMGVWFLGNFMAYLAGGYVASYVEEWGASAIFRNIAIGGIALGGVMLILSKLISKKMHGVH